jgi:hypothetical protein
VDPDKLVHIHRDGQSLGPYPWREVRNFLAAGALLPTDLGWSEGMSEWVPLGQLMGLPPPLPERSPAKTPAHRPAQIQNPPCPKTYLTEAIAVTLCCCVPFGIVSLVYAGQVKGKYDGGDYQGAVGVSGKAKGWCTAGFIIGLLVSLLTFLGNFLFGFLANLR